MHKYHDFCEFVIFPFAAVFPCVHSIRQEKELLWKRPSFPLPSSPQCQPGSFFKRCGVTVVWERMFVSDATCKMVLKQATQRTLFGEVTFGNGWSYFWKNVWAQKAFPFIIWYLNAFVKSAISWGRENVCWCETHRGEASFQFQVFIFGHACRTTRRVVLFSRKWACIFRWSYLPLACCYPSAWEMLIIEAKQVFFGSNKLQIYSHTGSKISSLRVSHLMCQCILPIYESGMKLLSSLFLC